MSLARQVTDRAAGRAPGTSGGEPATDLDALTSGDAPHAPRGPSTAEVATTTLVGASFEAADLTRSTAARAWRASAPARSMVAWLAEAPPARPLTTRVTTTIDRWQQRGEAETTAGRSEVRGLAQATVDEIAASDRLPEVVIEVIQPMLPVIVERALPDVLATALPGVMDQLSSDPAVINRLVDSLLPDLLPDVMGRIAAEPQPILELVNTIIGPLLEELLPQVIDQLGENPEPIRELVSGQTTSIAGDMVTAVRSRAVSGDERAERIVHRLLGRRDRQALLPPSTPAIGSGGISSSSSGTDPTADPAPERDG